MPEMDTVFLCLDNDRAGKKACERMAEELQEHCLGQGIHVKTSGRADREDALQKV